MVKKTTIKQARNYIPNPTGKGGFKERPQDIHNGAWKKEDTFRWKMEQLMKMSEKELREVEKDPNYSMLERRFAGFVMEENWTGVQQMINQVYGIPKQTMVTEDENGKQKPITGNVIKFE